MNISRRHFLVGTLLAGCATGARKKAGSRRGLIGYSQYRTNLDTRFLNQITTRAYIVETGGDHPRELCPELAQEPNTWTQFAGWSPDGRLAILGRGWESPENAAWEEEHKTFRMTEGWRFDIYTCDIQSGALTNLTAVERVSEYNSGVFFIPGGEGKLGFTALIDGISHPFVMDRDGRNKRDLSQNPGGFAYGFSASPDGRRVTYHQDYQIYLADAGGENATKVETGNPFNFVPQWSPDGEWLLFVSGEHYNCHPHICRADGTGLRQLASREGYEGVVTVYDVYDFHGGSSDVPVWAADGGSIFYTAKVNGAVELMQADLEGNIRQLTRSAPGTLNYHPKPHPDNQRLAFGSTPTGTRQLYVLDLHTDDTRPLTQVPPGHGAMWAHWQPT